MKSLFPEWLEPELLKIKTSPLDTFERTSSLSHSREILLVHTPGHTVGHCSVLVKTKDIHYFLAGDVTYNQDQLLNNVHAGGHQNFKHALQTYREIKNYGVRHKLIYLPSHDIGSMDRILKDQLLELASPSEF